MFTAECAVETVLNIDHYQYIGLRMLFWSTLCISQVQPTPASKCLNIYRRLTSVHSVSSEHVWICLVLMQLCCYKVIGLILHICIDGLLSRSSINDHCCRDSVQSAGSTACLECVLGFSVHQCPFHFVLWRKLIIVIVIVSCSIIIIVVPAAANVLYNWTYRCRRLPGLFQHPFLMASHSSQPVQL